MKKIFMIIAAMMLAVVPMLADEDRMIDREDLPKKAQVFLNEYFANAEVVYVKADREMGVVTSYDVVLMGDVKVEFSRGGEWTSVDCGLDRVPDGVLPQGVVKYVSSKFANAHVVEIERNKLGYDVKLSNDIDLDFGINGNFLRIDD